MVISDISNPVNKPNNYKTLMFNPSNHHLQFSTRTHTKAALVTSKNTDKKYETQEFWPYGIDMIGTNELDKQCWEDKTIGFFWEKNSLLNTS